MDADGPDVFDCTHVMECGFCAARESMLLKAQIELSKRPLARLKLLAFKLNAYLHDKAPWLLIVLDKILHPFGIELGVH